MQWDRYQAAVHEDMTRGDGHTIVNARAGSGKTTTLIAGLDCLPRWGTVLMAAFGTRARDELQARAPQHVKVKTIHQLGFLAVRNNVRGVEYDSDKGHRIAFAVSREIGRRTHSWNEKEQGLRLQRLASLAKGSFARSFDDIVDLAAEHNLEDDYFPATWLAQHVVECLHRATALPTKVDYDDMIYLPAKLGLRIPVYDFVLVDELQDLCAAQLHICYQATRRRFIGIGDPMQAIYLWRAAEADIMPRATQELGAGTLPLSVTYRCPRAVVAYVKSKVNGLDDLEAAPGAPEGEVTSRRASEMVGPFGARPGDFVLSRTNAPLIGLCLKFLRQGIPATVAGRDIGKSITKLLDRSAANTTTELLNWLVEYREKERDKHAAKGDEKRFASVADQIAAVRTLAQGTTKVSEIRARIQQIFVDDTPAGVITFSTVHKAKGLEADRVWLLKDTFPPLLGEEASVFYVACTRARHTLFLVDSESRPEDAMM